MASADFSQFAVATDFMLYFNLLVRSPRVRAMTFTSYTCHIYATGLGQYWTLLWVASSSAPHTPNVISVRQAEVLPPASFRFHLAMDTLAFG